jgi:hypothetical protein
MTKLHAIAFDRYKSEQTTEGVIYNIVDQEHNVIVQYFVSHKEYTLHDMYIENQSRAPSSMKRALQNYLDDRYGKDLWKIKTVFTGMMVKRSQRLRQITFNRDSIRLVYNMTDKQVETGKANQNSQNGF